MKPARITLWTELPAMLGLLLILALVVAMLGMADFVDATLIGAP